MFLFACLFSWMFGIFLSGYLAPNILVFIFPLFLMLLMLGIRLFYTEGSFRKIPGYSPALKVFFCLLLWALGAGRYYFAENSGYQNALRLQQEQPASLSGVIVSEVNRYDTTDYFYLQEDRGAKIRVSVRTAKPLMTGQRVTLMEPVITPVNIYNTKIQSTRKFLGNGATLTATFPYNATVTVEGIGNPLLYFAKWARVQTGKLFQRLFPGETAGFLTSLLSSDQTGLSGELYDDFISTGSIHILVVSGMHFNYLAGAILFLLGFFCHSRRTKLLITIPLLLIFSVFTGGTLPVLRAFFMTVALFLGELFYLKRWNSTLLVAVLASVFLLVSPTLIFNPSFLLTFGATFGITCFYQPLLGFLKKVPGSNFRSYLALQMSVQVFTFPVVCFFFARISTTGILTNFLVGPLVPVVLILAVLVPFLYRIPVISGILLSLTQWSSALFLWCVKKTARLAEPLHFSFDEIAFLLLLCLGVGLYFLLLSKQRKQRVTAGLLCIVLLTGSVTAILFPVRQKEVSITFFGASNTNSATVITRKNHKIVLGNLKDISHARYTAAFRAQEPISLLILTDFSNPELLGELLITHPVEQVVLPMAYREEWNFSCPVQFCGENLCTQIDGLILTLVTDGNTFSEIEFAYRDTLFSFTTDPEYLFEHWNENPAKYWIYNFKRTSRAARRIATIPHGERLISKKPWHPEGILSHNYSIIKADRKLLYLPELSE